MDIELGIQNVARPVNFSTEESADSVGKAIAQAVANGETINLTDDKVVTSSCPPRHWLCHHRFRDQARRRFRRSVTIRIVQGLTASLRESGGFVLSV